MANRMVSRLLRVFAICLLPIVTQAQTNSPNKPTWWAKYQSLATHGGAGRRGDKLPDSWYKRRRVQ